MLKLNYQKLLIGFSTLLLVIPGNAARITGENSIKEDWGCEAVDGEWSYKRTNKPMDIFDDTLTEDDREKTLAYDLA
ncbi:putative organic solvent tolerance protein [Francisella tularensis]|uniref:Uncharacterized protein n=3 Tax=Francisella tularensis TaxID=263 RepID=Q5NGU0_FRATT|nr:hypothetical protein NE061598_04245 [Francisella tularensis subsp. tularensis NE061598]AFB78858.1 Outer membrane protein Imp required for envelope biogenesis [Francisella tularensis subsp. tularensis TIGB03]AFB80403.1 Outer membrane protein Imp required for envelope biogenesis [Francisella tularensis subsp. tularensis TI0902]AJI68238.1 putative organic solvent tolerance protein [Francisella tularensis subsp. tularensis SCHU S4]AJI71251.1 putative organic solvent tolerance protein [Francisell